MNTSIAKVFGIQELPLIPQLEVDWVIPDQNIGIEIEAERGNGAKLPDTPLRFWRTTVDGSLISGKEYVLSQPFNGKQLSSAIAEMLLSNNKFKRSITSGTHIHLDMRETDVTVSVVQALTLLVAVIEPAIFSMFGESREATGYTNTIDSIDNEVVNAIFAEDTNESAQKMVEVYSRGRTYKYYGLNLSPLATYGSIEFRYFPTCTTAAELVEWVQFVQSVKKAAMSLSGMPGIKSAVADEYSWQEFISNFFNPWAEKISQSVSHRRARSRYFKFKSIARAYVSNSGQPAQNSGFVDTAKFKKFFAVRSKDPITGKMKVTYGKSTINQEHISNPNFYNAAVGDLFFVRNEVHKKITSSDSVRVASFNNLIGNTATLTLHQRQSVNEKMALSNSIKLLISSTFTNERPVASSRISELRLWYTACEDSYNSLMDIASREVF